MYVDICIYIYIHTIYIYIYIYTNPEYSHRVACRPTTFAAKSKEVLQVAACRSKSEALPGNLRLPSSCSELQLFTESRDIPPWPWVGRGRRLYSGMHGLLTLLCTWIYTRQDIYKSRVLSPSGLSPNYFCCQEQRGTASRGLPKQKRSTTRKPQVAQQLLGTSTVHRKP